MTTAAYIATWTLCWTAMALLTGCSSSPPPPVEQPITQDMNLVLSALDAHAAVRFPMLRSGSVLPAEMNRPVDWHWSGHITDGVRLIATKVGYTAIVPERNDGPVVSIDRENVPIHSVLDELAAAAGTRMTIEVDIPSHVIRAY
ncbi:DotD/TraH family lipoprotein [Gluconacetobacter diazotrophicus]|uniref:DotD/TraH family lipoprotein n=1 Tax=Gluconacetobacter diazotrophicus TaxID=33996 RepID=A0A7W4FFJ3_GLUDI|nr:DotD/TraH family lipoprotein [Gluconacetobacter diazotrophicus]MBB2156614.1 DotD/TraH family lipoprotein [Gluconacetobacter diazotrophicus]